MTNPLQTKFRRQFVEHFLSEGEDFKSLDRYLFGNFSGTRLSKNGYQLVKSAFKPYPFHIPSDILLSVKHLVSLNKNMIYPYYLDSRVIVFFSETDAHHYMLVDDILLFIKSISD